MQFKKIFFLNRPEDGVAPADLSLLTPPGDADFGPCRLSSPPISERRRVLPSHMFKTPQRHTPVRVEEGINLPEFGARQTSNCYFFLCRSRLQQVVFHSVLLNLRRFTQFVNWINLNKKKHSCSFLDFSCAAGHCVLAQIHSRAEQKKKKRSTKG